MPTTRPGAAPLSAWPCRLPEFVTGLDQLRAENGLGKIRKRKDRYCGIRLVDLLISRDSGMMSWRRASVALCRRPSRPVQPGRGRSRPSRRHRRDRIREGSLGLVLRRAIGPPVTRRRLQCVRLIERKRIEVAKRAKMRALNDDFRRTFRGGRVMITAGVNALTHTVQRAVFQKIQAFDAFDDERDPWDNHGFVSVEHDGQTFFAKIDLYESS